MKKKSKKTTEASSGAPGATSPKKHFHKTRWILSLVLPLVLLTGVGAAAAHKIQQLPEATFVKVFFTPGLDFSTLTTFEEAQNQLTQKTKNFLTSPVSFTSARGDLTGTLESLGVSVDTAAAEQTLNNFMEQATVLEKTYVLLFGEDLETPLVLDEVAFKAALAPLNIEQGLKDAHFVWEGNAVQIQPEQMGYGLDTSALAATLEDLWKEFTPTATSTQATLLMVDLPLRTSSPQIVSKDLASLVETAQNLSTQSLTLEDDYGNAWTLAMQDHLDWVKPIRGYNSTGLDWEISDEAFTTYIETELSPTVEEEPEGATITQNADGTYSFEGSARFGRKIDKPALKAAIFTMLTSASAAKVQAPPGSTPIDLPILQEQPLIAVPESLKNMGITELVGVGYSDFSGSPPNRIHNVNQGVIQFNGVLIPQGAEFSFMGHLSPVDAAHGFLPELVIKGDETIPEYGGGMCQVSSTMYRAALYSGLPITARINHSYAVSYYARPFGYGLDATVYDPAPDLKFINDTPGAILVQAYTEGNSAYYVFYGTNDGRRVTMDGPRAYDYSSVPDVTTYVDTLAPGERKLKEHGHQGFKVDWTRTILHVDGTETSENIHSNYEARPEKWEEGKAAE